MRNKKMEQNNEIWYDVPGYEGYYQFSVSNSITGKVRSVERTVPNQKYGTMTLKGHILKPHDNGHGYLFVRLCKNGIQKNVYIHKIVAKQLVYNPDPEHLTEINHKSEDKQDNRPSNIEWVTKQYNLNYGTRNQRVAISNTNNPKRSKPLRCIETNVVYPSVMEVERQTGIWNPNIVSCLHGRLKTAGGYHWEYV